MSSTTAIVDLLPINLDGETVYVTWQEAAAVHLARLLEKGVPWLMNRVAAIGPAKLLLWAGFGSLLLVATFSDGDHGNRKRRRLACPKKSLR